MATSLKRKLLILPPVLLGVALIAVMAGSKKTPDQAPPGEQARAVRVVEAVAQPVIPRVLGYGAVTPQKVWNAVAQVSGQVVEIHPRFKQGAMLPEGTVLLRLAPEDYELKIAELEANVRAFRLQHRELAATVENTRKSIEIEARALALKEQELERKRKLLEKGSISQSAVDAEQRDMLAQRQQVQNLRNTATLLPIQMDELKQQIAVAEIQTDQARLDLARIEIKLPFDARIAEANAEITQFVQAGQQVAVADGVKTSEVSAQLPIALFGALLRRSTGENPSPLTARNLSGVFERMGITAEVRLRTGGRIIRWQGQVARISDTIDPQTRTVGVFVAVENTYDEARPGVRPPLVKGMYVEVELRAATARPGILLPRAAVRDGTVFVVDTASRLASRAVMLGMAQGDFVVVEAGLDAGDRVVVTDLVPAVEGMLLAPVRDLALEARLAQTAAGEGEAR